jgi:hypothetical protein
LELSRAGKRVLRTGGDDTAPADVTGPRQWLQRAARGLLYHPDAQVGWTVPAVRAARRALHGKPVDAIFSSSFPVTAHLVARRLHRGLGAPWVAEFRDPWSLALPGGSVQRRRALRLERSLTREADCLITVSPSWARTFGEAWARPVGVVPNGHGFAALRSVEPAGAAEELVVGYLGTYYPDLQDLSPAWRALAQSGRPARIRLIGAPNPALMAELQQHGLGDRLEVTGFLAHDAALDELATCSVLLLAGPRDASGILRGHVVAKVWEYLATNLPIVYVGDVGADVADILRAQPGCAVHALDDTRGITTSLATVQEQRIARESDAFSRRARTAELARILDATVAGRVW